MTTNKKQDAFKREFGVEFDDVRLYLQDQFKPEDVFCADDLSDWAENNDYVSKDEQA